MVLMGGAKRPQVLGLDGVEGLGTRAHCFSQKRQRADEGTGWFPMTGL